MRGNFAACLAVTLQWEGGYSNHPDDPGGPTMRGIIQREYDAWRTKHGLAQRPVHQIEETELEAIYRDEYWNALGCDDLPLGVDLCVFDAGVNSGVGRAREWMTGNPQIASIDTICDRRLAFLERLGHLWRVFGAGWSRRVAGVRHEAHVMAGEATVAPGELEELHAGMTGDAVRTLQSRLQAAGYKLEVDGVFGQQTFGAVVAFQKAHGLTPDGVVGPLTEKALEAA